MCPSSENTPQVEELLICFGLCHISLLLTPRREDPIKRLISCTYLKLDPNMSTFNVLIQHPYDFSSTGEKHPYPDEKSNSEFSLLKFMIMSCQLLWHYISSVWLAALQQPCTAGVCGQPGKAECSSKTSLCLDCMTAASSSAVCSQTDTTRGDQTRSHLQG